MKTAMQNYGENDKQHDGVKQTWDIVQSDFKCCGVEKYSDWFDTPYGKDVNGVPDSCCKVETAGCGKNIEGSSDIQDKINTNGCFSQFEGKYSKRCVYFLERAKNCECCSKWGILFIRVGIMKGRFNSFFLLCGCVGQ